MRHLTTPFSGLLAALLAAGCAVQPASGTPGNQQSPGRSDAVQPREFTLETAIQAARADAARKTGGAADAFLVLGAERVTWSDGSLGCPAPGMFYTQALVPGYRIRLQAPTGQAFDYHASRRGDLVLCPAGRAIDPAAAASTR